MKLAWFTPLRPAHAGARDDVSRLIPALTRDHQVAVLSGEAEPADGAGLVVHDLRAVHYRKLLWRYDLVVYALADESAHDYMHDALEEWPGLVIAYDDDLEALFHRRPTLRLAVLERSLLLAVRGPEPAARLRREAPFTEIAELAAGSSIADRARSLERLCARAGAVRRRWLEPLLEAACADLPGWLPGDPRAPWHAAVVELLSLAPRRGGRE